MNSIINNSSSSYWQIVIFLKNKTIRDRLRNFLNTNGIETRTTFPLVHTMPMYKEKKNKIKLKNSTALASTGMCLPSSPTLKKKEIMLICNLINNFI